MKNDMKKKEKKRFYWKMKMSNCGILVSLLALHSSYGRILAWIRSACRFLNLVLFVLSSILDELLDKLWNILCTVNWIYWMKNLKCTFNLSLHLVEQSILRPEVLTLIWKYRTQQTFNISLDWHWLWPLAPNRL